MVNISPTPRFSDAPVRTARFLPTPLFVNVKMLSREIEKGIHNTSQYQPPVPLTLYEAQWWGEIDPSATGSSGIRGHGIDSKTTAGRPLLFFSSLIIDHGPRKENIQNTQVRTLHLRQGHCKQRKLKEKGRFNTEVIASRYVRFTADHTQGRSKYC